MTSEEKGFLIDLIKDRTESADVLEKPSLSGVQHSVVEKYSDQAHFIYELLQNADDAFATEAKFFLEENHLVFIHNGTKHFNITNPLTEAEDGKNKKLGDLNAITSVANSAKNGNKATIGKFGVGFKAVFQYTNTPHIYDPNVAFKIERFIVPQQLDADYPGRKPNETVFVFPFDHKERNAHEAFEDISDKLRHLVYPVLFLQSLKYVSFEIKGTHAIGMYEKKCILTKNFGDILAQKYELVYTETGDIVTEYLWLFSRKDDSDRDYCVGYFCDKNGKLKSVHMPAFCYFPTKEETNLNFIIHAPFLLTDSREGIKAGEEYNKNLITLLAKLAADALECLREIGETEKNRLIDDTILTIVPITSNVFSPLNDKAKISFLPFFEKIKEALIKGLLPGKDNYYAKDVAYWADTLDICNLFSDEQLTQLFNREAHWVFRTYGRNTASHNAVEGLQKYIDELTRNFVRETYITSFIDYNFIKRQSFEWLHKFYKWLAEKPVRYNWLKTDPIFINAEGKPAAAYDDDEEKTLFLPSAAGKDCPTVHPDLLKNPDTKAFLLDVVKLEEPSIKDYIYNTVIPNFENDENGDPFNYFIKFFAFYKECRATETEEYLNRIKNLKFLEYLDTDENGDGWYYYPSAPSDLYFPNDELKEFFSPAKNIHFLAIEQYTDAYPDDTDLIPFLIALGVKLQPKVYQHQLTSAEIEKYTDLPPLEYSTHYQRYVETRIEGGLELAEYVAKNMIAAKSFLLWDNIVAVINAGNHIIRDGQYQYFFRCCKTIYYKSKMVETLQTEKWLVDKAGNFVSAAEISPSMLSDAYEKESDAARELINVLEFAAEPEEKTLTEDEKLANLCKKYGVVTEDQFRKYEEWRQQQESQNNPLPKESPDAPVKTIQSTVENIAKDIIKTAKKQKEQKENKEAPTDKPADKSADEVTLAASEPEEIDRDEYIPGVVDYAKKIENEKEKQAEELQDLATMQELQDKALSADKYSLLWFKTLLDMEILISDADSMNSREVDISFGEIEKDDNAQKTYVLNHPSKYIPQFMEDLADIPLNIRFKDGTSKKVAIEVASVQSYSLRVKLKDADAMSGINLADVQQVSIKAVRPVFLLQELRNRLDELKDKNGNALSDDFNMKDNLPENIEFVFGPPGTGKTTYLANEVLRPLMRQKEDLKVLVLTPTNKAADVITMRIIESMDTDTSYTEWLTRFGNTGDERIEACNVFRDKTFDFRDMNRSVIITTIARFAYDYFMPGNERLFLDAYNWDYIVIDEASMIPLVEIIYPLIRKTPRKFIIAGDPFQIEPITTVDMWADENVYKMVELNSFTNPKTVPHDYPVVKLTTQYRSTPEIGTVFSKFTYGGILQHNRTSSSRRDLHLDGIINIDSLNVLKFPVSKYESIYRPKRLNGTTPYQTYSAIFTMEFAGFLARKLAERNPGEKFTIGIIAPYKAQASLIDHLTASLQISKDIQIQAGTIHGFQGDECDIVLVVLNTPPSITNSPNLFLNKQNVLNVAISRARDYLFVIMPDTKTENLCRLQKVKLIEDLMRQSDHFVEQDTSSVEIIMFDDDKFIENNSFATGHQSVNVYGVPEKRYEIRSEDTAIDVQVHLTKQKEQTI